MRAPGDTALSFEFFPADFAENVVGYVPLGLVFAELGLLRAVAASALISTISEISQIAMMYRDPSAVDILANTVGAALGVGISAGWKLGLPEVTLNRWIGLATTIAACAIVSWAYIPILAPINARGFTSPGMLEAHWKLDESDGATAQDSSGHGLRGRTHNPPKRVEGVLNA